MNTSSNRVMAGASFTAEAGDKCFKSRFFEDYAVDEPILHPVPRTVTRGDVALYTATTGSRFALHCNDHLAQAVGYPQAPLDDILTFHMVFGRTVPDISLNAVANLGYARVVFGVPVYPGDTLSASSKVIGVKENSNRKTGTVYVHSTGINQHGQIVLDYIRWVMMRKKDPASPAPQPVVPENLPPSVPIADLQIPQGLNFAAWKPEITGSDAFFEDYAIGERIHHLDGQTIEEAEHQMATRLYQNNARVHFNQHVEKEGRFGRRIIYGGYIISLARAISCNGLANAFRVAAINAGRHSAPSFAGDTIYAWSEILEKHDLALEAGDCAQQMGAMRIRTLASKDHAQADFPDAAGLPPHIVLDLDYTVLIPKRGARGASV